MSIETNCLQGDELATGGNHAAGELQLLLYHHLHKCPNAIVHIQNLGQIHADLLTVLLAVLSEQVTTYNITIYSILSLAVIKRMTASMLSVNLTAFTLCTGKNLCKQIFIFIHLTSEHLGILQVRLLML